MKKVLICDDEVLTCQGIRKILMSAYEDIEIREAKNGAEGYREITLWRPDVVITDIKMPVLSGLGMLEKASQASIPFSAIVISAYSDFEYARTAIRYGVREYILKPINRFELIACLNRLWESAKLEISLKDGGEQEDPADVIGKALKYIEANYYRNIGLEDVAGAVDMNANYLSSLFKKRCGMRYIDYLTNLRMEKARELLRNTDLKVNDIAEMVGYNSAKHFSRLYKDKYSVSPSEER